MNDQLARDSRARFAVIAHTMLISGSSVFLLRRNRTGALDGWYSLPGGHLELGETITECATRECSEETGIEVENLKLRRVHSYLFRGDQGLNFIFTSKEWTGLPHIGEPEFFNDGGFFLFDELPPKTLTWVKDAVDAYRKNQNDFELVENFD